MAQATVPSAARASALCAAPSSGPSGSWPADRIALLTRLWMVDGLTAAVISRRLGVSRNAVLGKVHRLGLSNRRRAAAPKVRAPRRVGPRPRAPMGKTPARAAASPPDDLASLAARLEDLGPHTCHWPIGDPKAEAFGFCGRAAQAPPYCGAHREVAYRGSARPLESYLGTVRAG